MPFHRLRIGDLEEHAVGDLAGPTEHSRPIARDVERDARARRPFERERHRLGRLGVPVLVGGSCRRVRDLLAVRQTVDLDRRLLEFLEARRPLAEAPNRTVAPPQAEDHSATAHFLKRGVKARDHGRVARYGIGDAGTDLGRRRALHEYGEVGAHLAPVDRGIGHVHVLETVLLDEACLVADRGAGIELSAERNHDVLLQWKCRLSSSLDPTKSKPTEARLRTGGLDREARDRTDGRQAGRRGLGERRPRPCRRGRLPW